jgi:hypothetical protein
MAGFMGNARGRLFAVVDEPAKADDVVGALVTAGIDRSRVEVLTGAPAADAFDGTGARHGPLSRLLRTVQFTLMDQMPDFAWYEAAARGGRAIIAVRSSNEAETRRAVDVLRAHGAHFINYFGRFSTEEFDRWRGPEPDLPGYMRR